MHLADFLCSYVVLSRSRENGGKSIQGDGDDGTCAAFAEEGVFGGARVIVESDGCSADGHGMPCPYRSEAGFGYGNGQASVADVVDGLHGAVCSQGD